MIKASNNPFECSPAIIGSGQPNALISLGPIERVGNNFSIPALGVAYRISGTVHSNLDAFAFTIAPENVLNRIDWIVGTPSGIQHLVGEPFLDIVTSPAISDPENTILIKEYKIEGSNIGEGSAPIIGDPYIQKNQFNQSGDVNGKFYIGQQSNFPITNPAITEVKGLCNVNEMEEGLYTGKFHYWSNLLPTSVWFRHLDGSDPAVRYPLYLPGEVDFELKPGMSILLFHSIIDIPIDFEYGYLRFLAGHFQQKESKKQITVTENKTATNDWNGAIVKVKATAKITIPSGLVAGFEFDYATFTGAVATLENGVGVTLNSSNGLILQEKKMGTLFNDTLNVYEVRGDQTPS